MAIERVEGWKDSNGVIHDTEEKALEAEREKWLKVKLERWCQNNFSYSSTQSAVYGVILKNKDELLDILNPKK